MSATKKKIKKQIKEKIFQLKKTNNKNHVPNVPKNYHIWEHETPGTIWNKLAVENCSTTNWPKRFEFEEWSSEMTSHALHVRICFKLLNHIPCNSPQHWAWFCARFHHHLKPTNCDSMRNLDFKSLFSYLKVRNLPVDICSTLSNFQFATNFSPFSSLANPKQSSPAFVKNYHHAPWWRKVERTFFNLIRPSPALAKKNVKKNEGDSPRCGNWWEEVILEEWNRFTGQYKDGSWLQWKLEGASPHVKKL